MLYFISFVYVCVLERFRCQRCKVKRGIFTYCTYTARSNVLILVAVTCLDPGLSNCTTQMVMVNINGDEGENINPTQQLGEKPDVYTYPLNIYSFHLFYTLSYSLTCSLIQLICHFRSLFKQLANIFSPKWHVLSFGYEQKKVIYL